MTANTPLENELLAAGGSLDNLEILRGVLAGSGDCIKILDLDGRLQFMSEGGQQVMEVDDFAPLKGCPWPDFWTGQGNKDASEAIRAALRGEVARFQGPANTAKGTPRYWDVRVSPIHGQSGKITHILSISRDITKEHQAAAHQAYLFEELQHRIKNMLGVVMAIAKQTFKGDENRGARQAFDERIAALDDAHKALNVTEWHESSVRQIVERALHGHTINPRAINVEGPVVRIGAKQALALALATNELATNAVKHGSLKAADGRVDVSWNVTPQDFTWEWRESGGREVSKPTRAGFGERVIRDMLAHETGGKSELAYERSGVICRLTVPVERLLSQ